MCIGCLERKSLIRQYPRILEDLMVRVVGGVAPAPDDTGNAERDEEVVSDKDDGALLDVDETGDDTDYEPSPKGRSKDVLKAELCL